MNDGSDPRVISFDSIEDAFEAMRRGREQANAHLSEEQAGLSWGDYFLSYDNYSGLLIFARCMPLEEVMAKEIELGAEEAEVDYVRRHMEDTHVAGSLFGNHFSVVEPTGELGNTHRFKCWPITEAQYRAMEAGGWDPQITLTQDMEATVAVYRALMSLREHWRRCGVVNG